MNRIDTKTGRDRLPARREPHWLRLESGRALGFRKTESTGSWIARYRDDHGRQKYKALGSSPGLEFDEAKRAAEAWFRTLAGSGHAAPKSGTVAAACEAYAANLDAEGRTAAAADARARFRQLVNDAPLGRIRLDALKRDDVQAWRDALLTDGRGKAGANRHLRTLKAALNEAVRLGYAASPEAWRTVRPFANAEQARDVFLNLKQRRAILEHSPPALRAFLLGMLHTAARPGELARATVADFDKRQGNVTLRTQKGRSGAVRTRVVPLTPAALKVFKAAARQKLPTAPLFADPAGSPWHRVALSRALRAAAAEAKVPGVVAYTLRHSAISEWLSAGIDGVTVAKLAGTSVAMLERHYHKFIKAPALAKLEGIALV